MTDASPTPTNPSDKSNTNPSPTLDELGARLQAALGDGYAVEGKLGSGGFAVVYLVRDLSLKRELAVKVLSPDVIASHSVLERFRREAETVAQLSHPHIVPLHFIGQKGDLVYLVMQAISGGSLADKLQREGRLSIEDAARIFSEVASALAHAHKRGVIHRDIKPQNVLLDAETGRALVTDFGIARTAEGGSLTATGMVVGTPAYLSPEQVTGEHSDHRADIYALGVMMYEMLAGQPPFTGPTPTAVLMKRLGGPPEPLRSVRAEVPPQLEELVDACLATDPAERLQNAADITRALTGASPVSGGHTTSTRLRVSSRKKPRSNAVTFGIVGAVILLAAVGGYLMSREKGVPALVPPPVDPGMVLIPAGTFTIGRDDGPAASRPSHQVQLGAFGIDTTEITVPQYKAYVDAGKAPAPWSRYDGSPTPVTDVLWSEATGYCAWKHPDGGRLPTEQEWEAAARGQSGRVYPWGNAWNVAAANTGSARRGGPEPVASHPLGRSPEGVHDLIGNVWEWTSSQLFPYPGGAPITGAGELYVIRGGAYNSLDAIATATFRTGARPATARSDLHATGFRCAMPARATAVR